MANTILKRRSGKYETGRERFELGVLMEDGVRVKTLDCDVRDGFETRSSGSASGRPAAKEIVAALDINSTIRFIVFGRRS